MSLHDAYARTTPFEFLFDDAEEAGSLSAAVAEEAAGRGIDDASPHAFVTMGVVTEFIRRIEGDDAPAEAIHPYGALAFQAVHFERAGRPVYLLSTHAARYLVDGAAGDDPAPVESAGYLQLPRHLFWLEDQGGGPPQSVDGIAWTTATASESGADVLHVLLATGLLADRSALQVVPLPEAPLADRVEWLMVRARREGEGEDFANPMPGAELDGLCLFATAGEVLKLLARFFAYARATPQALEPGALGPHAAQPPTGEPGDGEPGDGEAGDGEAGAGEAGVGADAPVPSKLPWTRVTLPA